FFFQAEDGIRDGHVTGVQTCALPILILPYNARTSNESNSSGSRAFRSGNIHCSIRDFQNWFGRTDRRGPEAVWKYSPPRDLLPRSEERRVGKEDRSGWA